MSPKNSQPPDSDGQPLLIELDRRQTQVMKDLDDLDRRILEMLDDLSGK